MSRTAETLNGFNSLKIEEEIMVEVGSNVEISQKLKSRSTLKLHGWRLVEAIKNPTSNFEGVNVPNSWKVEWLKMVENWRRRYISKEVKVWRVVEHGPIDSHVKNGA